MQQLLWEIREQFPVDQWQNAETWEKVNKIKGNREIIDYIYDKLGLEMSSKVVTRG